MSGRIPDDVLESIRQRISIVEVVSAYVALKKSGRNHQGLCPFHNEKTPSFNVSEERGFFHCFGCGAGGSVFTFLMRIDKLEFVEAVEQLAKRAGVALPKADRGPGADLRSSLVAINQVAQEYFVAALHSPRGEAARRYVHERGVAPRIVEQYGLGFCPAQGGLLRALGVRPAASQAALQLGLIGRRTDGSPYDRFWGRLMFPIRDSGGRVIGFGGRALGEQQPKYLNSPESALFRKGEVLYGLYEARQSIREAERVVIVEGYLDALALVEAGIPYTVAALGTALGAAQLRLARRFAREVIAFFDGDTAGQKAAARAFGVCAEAGVWGLGAFLPQGFDPDTYVRQQGGAATLALLQHAIPLADFFLQHMDPGPNATVPQRVRAAEQVAEVIARVEDVAQFSVLAKRAAEVLGVDEEVFRRPRAPERRLNPTRPQTPESTPYRPEELTLVEAMALDAAVAGEIEADGVLAHFDSQELVETAGRICAAWRKGLSIAALVDDLPAALAMRLRATLLGDGPMASSDPGQIARDCSARIKERRRRAQVKELRSQVRQSEGSSDTGLLKTLRDQLRQRRAEPP